jgi:hypothetical protein
MNIETYNPKAIDKALADSTHAELKLKALVQLDMIRESLFLDVMDTTASVKDKLAFAEHLVKSTMLEAEAKKAAEVVPTFNFGFAFQAPDGGTKVVGAVIDNSTEVVQAAKGGVSERDTGDENEDAAWGSLVEESA